MGGLMLVGGTLLLVFLLSVRDVEGLLDLSLIV